MNHKLKPGALVVINDKTDAPHRIGDTATVSYRYTVGKKSWYRIIFHTDTDMKPTKFKATSLDLINES